MTACNAGDEEVQQVPHAPTIQISYVENRLISVLWNTVEGADIYVLYWNTTGDVSTSDNRLVVPQTSSPSINIGQAGLSFFKTYYYMAIAVNALGESSPSNEVSALPFVTSEELWKRAASDYEDGDEMGRSVAISGDYIIGGAPNEDGNGFDCGAAYIFYRDLGGVDAWGEVTKLTASDAADSDSFGHSVAISGDYAVVGAPNADGAGSDQGAAYIFYRDLGGVDAWGEVTK
ncbi:FG-GAP repeat protein, partial [bacterium]|nr:FG-GAP repeat protein [bacterium]